MPHAGPRTAAHAFLSLRSYVEATYGAGSFRAVRAAIAGRYPAFPQVIVPASWHPTPAYQAMLEAAHDVFGPEDFYEKCGHATVAYEVSVFLRFVLRVTSPLWVVERATEAWRNSHTT